MAVLIVYACPVGTLAQQIETYLQQSQQQCGNNAAHAYMPHCTLTGFFQDEEHAIPHYIQAIETALVQQQAQRAELSVEVKQMIFQDRWHGLALEAEGLKHLVKTFAAQAESPTRPEKLRLKDWLHLSLAYGFEARHKQPLQQLAKKQIDIAAPVNWELRFYERAQHNQWTCHHRWDLTSSCKPSSTSNTDHD